MQMKVTVKGLVALFVLGACTAWGRSVTLDLRSPVSPRAAARLMSASSDDFGTLRHVDLDVGAATVGGIDGLSGRDFQYVKQYLEWEDGDDSDQEVEIPTVAAWWDGEPRTFRLKLSVQTTGDYAGCVTPALASNGKVIASIEPNDAFCPGVVKVTKVETVSCCSVRADEPLTAPPWWGYAGDTLRVTVSRVGGSFGRVVVKAKTQGYPGVSNLSAVLNEDLTYVKEYLEWKDGETGDQVVDVPTALVDGVTYPRTFRLKFTAQTTGDYAGCAAPEIPDPKVTVSLYR